MDSLDNLYNKYIKIIEGIQCFGSDKKQTSDIYMVTDIISDLFNNQFQLDNGLKLDEWY